MLIEEPEIELKFRNVRLPSAALAIASVTFIAIVLAAGCSSSPGTSAGPQAAPSAPAPVRDLEKTSIVVDDFPSVDSAGLYIAQLEGFFGDEGLNVKINEVFTGSQQTVNSIENGSADISSADYVTYLDNELLQHAKLRIIAEASTLQPSQLEMLVAHGSSIDKVRELAGKTIAVAGHDDIATLLIDSLLTENNVPLRQVTIEPGKQLPAIPALLDKHVIDAGPVPEPFVSEGEESLGVQELADLDQGATLNFPIQGFAVTQTWAERNPNTLRAFVAALAEGQQVADTNRHEVELATEKFLGVPPMTAAVMALPEFPLSVDSTQLQRVVDDMVQFGFVPASDATFRVSSMVG
jgi:NitT/TauT family transport system substrate-binding protein